MNNNKGVALYAQQTEVVRVDYTEFSQYPGCGFYGPIKILRFLNDNLRVLRRAAAEFQGLISEYRSPAVVIPFPEIDVDDLLLVRKRAIIEKTYCVVPRLLI